MKSIFEAAGMANCKAVPTPGINSRTYQAGDEQPLRESDHRLFRGLVGQLVYIAADGPDLKFAAKEVAYEEASKLSMRKVKRATKYLAGTRHCVARLEHWHVSAGVGHVLKLKVRLYTVSISAMSLAVSRGWACARS